MRHAKVMRAIAFLMPLFGNVAHSTPNYQDAWWNPNQSGMGMMVIHQSNTVAAAWYFFGSDGKATYLLLSGPLNGNSVSGSLRRSTGPEPGPGFSPSSVVEMSVGTATLTFTTSTTATLSYSFDGLTGSLQLTRMSIAQPELNKSWSFAARATLSQCSNSQNNGTGIGIGTLTITQGNNNSIAIITDPALGSPCTFSTNFSQSGTVYSANGSFTCGNGLGGTASFSDVRVSDDFLTMSYALNYTQGETCRESGKIGGVPSN